MTQMSQMTSPATSVPSETSVTEPSGKRVVFWLFAGLWVMTAVVLVYFALITETEFRRRIWVALVVDLMLPFVAWQAFMLIDARRRI